MTRRDWDLATAFDRAAPTYDAMVALSPGYHDQLRTAAEALVQRLPTGAAVGRPVTVLDLGCGSGASTQAVLAAWSARGDDPADLRVTGVDASAGMVAQARAKDWPATVDLVLSDAVAHLEPLADGSVDGVLGAYLLRNVPEYSGLPLAPSLASPASSSGSRTPRARRSTRTSATPTPSTSATSRGCRSTRPTLPRARWSSAPFTTTA